MKVNNADAYNSSPTQVLSLYIKCIVRFLSLLLKAELKKSAYRVTLENQE